MRAHIAPLTLAMAKHGNTRGAHVTIHVDPNDGVQVSRVDLYTSETTVS